jgi:hypothetical protein
MSEQIFLVNPRHAKRRRKGRMPPALARYWATHRRKLKNPSRRKARRHAGRRRAAAGYVVGNRKIRRRKLNPRHRARRYAHHARRRHRRSNPRFFGMGHIVRGTLMPAAIGAGGAIALDVAMGYAQPYLPAQLQSGYLPILVKLAGALGIGYVAGKVLGRERGRVATLGAVTVVAYGALKSQLAQMLPSVKGLSGYADFVDYSTGARPAGVGAYLPQAGMHGLGFTSPAAVMQQPGLYAGDTGMGAYQPRSLAPAGGMAGFADPTGYDWRSDGM